MDNVLEIPSVVGDPNSGGLDPSMLMMLLPLLSQASSGGGGGGLDASSLQDMIASVSGGAFPSSGSSTTTSSSGGIGGILKGLLSGGSIGTGLGSFLGPLFGDQSGGETGQLGGLAGTALGGLLGFLIPGIGPLLGPLLGGLGGDLIGGLFQGVPREQATQQVEGVLGSSGDPIQQMLAQYMQKDILGKGLVLSSPNDAGFGKMAQVLEWLSGDSLPGMSKSGMSTSLGGDPLPVPRDISRLNALLGQSPNLSPSEIEAFLPQIEAMVSGGGVGMKTLGPQILALINSVSGQQQAKAAGANQGGPSTPTGTGGNALAAVLGGGAGGGMNKSSMNATLAKLKAMMGGGAFGDQSSSIVGATA